MDKITSLQLVPLFTAVATIMEQHADELCKMDAFMGDGDLGLTMKKGFTSLPAILQEIDEPDIGKRIAKAGIKMSSVVPSTMGTLMSSGLMSGGKAISGAEAIDAQSYAVYLQGFADGIQKRGKCVPGDRTVLDAIHPAAVAAQKADANGQTLQDVAKAALQGAEDGLAATKDMEPKFGKAAVFSQKAKGVIDQGAYAGKLMIEAMTNYILSDAQ